MPSKNIVFIDSRVSDSQAIIDGLSDPAEVFILDGESDGLLQMAEYLKGRSDIDAIHVISHGSQGALYLGSAVLSVRLLSVTNGSPVNTSLNFDVQTSIVVNAVTIGFSGGSETVTWVYGSTYRVGATPPSSPTQLDQYTYTGAAKLISEGEYVAVSHGQGQYILVQITNSQSVNHGGAINGVVFKSAGVSLSAPNAALFSPLDEQVGIPINSAIVATFTETIQRGTGNIVLKTASGSVVATYDAATSGNLTINGSTLTINPTADLAYSTGYKVEFSAGSIKDLDGNSYAGTTSYNFTTVAGTGNQTLTGTSGADVLTSCPGNDTIDGGAGIDTVAFSGNLASYALNKSGSTYTVRAKTGTDGTVNLKAKGIAAAAPLADVQRISELYVAFFNCTPDADGLAYWIGQKMAGQSINQISESLYTVGASSTFSALTGFSTSMTNVDFLNVFYKNVLGRPEGADAGGLAYWNGKLADGSSTRSSLANDISDSAHTFKGNPT